MNICTKCRALLVKNEIKCPYCGALNLDYDRLTRFEMQQKKSQSNYNPLKAGVDSFTALYKKYYDKDKAPFLPYFSSKSYEKQNSSKLLYDYLVFPLRFNSQTSQDIYKKYKPKYKN